MKRKEAKKLVLYFRLSMRKQSETNPFSLHFASFRFEAKKNFKRNRRTQVMPKSPLNFILKLTKESMNIQQTIL
jgi:hypothetical protein